MPDRIAAEPRHKSKYFLIFGAGCCGNFRSLLGESPQNGRPIIELNVGFARIGPRPDFYLNLPMRKAGKTNALKNDGHLCVTAHTAILDSVKLPTRHISCIFRNRRFGTASKVFQACSCH